MHCFLLASSAVRLQSKNEHIFSSVLRHFEPPRHASRAIDFKHSCPGLERVDQHINNVTDHQ
jgi:hypothetical protein